MILAEETGLGGRKEWRYRAHAGALHMCVCARNPSSADGGGGFTPLFLASPEDREPHASSPPRTVYQVHSMPPRTWLERSELTSQSHGFRGGEAAGQVVASGSQAFCVVSPLIALDVCISVHSLPPRPSRAPLLSLSSSPLHISEPAGHALLLCLVAWLFVC